MKTMNMNFLVKVCAVALILIFSINTASSQPYTASSQPEAWGYVCGAVQLPGSTLSSGNLYEFNLVNGTATLVGSVLCNGSTPALLAGEFVDEVFYGLNDNAPKTLVSIAQDASCNVIGPLTGLVAGHIVSGLSHDLTTGLTYVLSTNGFSSHLYTINLTTGALTTIGNIAGVPGGISLMISTTGAAYIIDINTDAIFPMDLTNATAGASVPITFNGNPLDLNFAQDADFSCAMDGQIYGVLYTGGGVGRYGTLNPNTGVFTQISLLGAEVCAFSVNCVTLIPTMSDWGLIILALLFLNITAVYSSQRKLAFAGYGFQFSHKGSVPFDSKIFKRSLIMVSLFVIAIFAAFIVFADYSLTAADIPGSLISIPLLAYFVHLLISPGE